jgi:hypothetical protein
VIGQTLPLKFSGGGLSAPGKMMIDSKGNVWAGNNPPDPIAELCGYRTETCPPGMKMGDPISPPGGFVGGGMQIQVDIAIDPAGDVWVGNNWQMYQAALAHVDEAQTTLGADREDKLPIRPKRRRRPKPALWISYQCPEGGLDLSILVPIWLP